jgi:hypothetical protein
MARYLHINEINTQIDALGTTASLTGLVTITNLPHTTIDGNTVKCIRINRARSGVTPVPVLIVGGLHAREWAPPDSLIDFARRFLTAVSTTTPYTDPRFVMTNPDADTNDPGYTGRIVFDATPPSLFSSPDVQRVVENVELFIVPCVNPDGRAFTQSPGNIPSMLESAGNPVPVNTKWWRKNRKNMGTCADGTPAIGVDINRNFSGSPGWDFNKYYNASTLSTATSRGNIAVTDVMDTAAFLTDEFPMSFHGSTTPEAETQNILNLITNHNIKFFLDVHSFQREIYYPWGINENQTTDQFKSQYNLHWDNDPANPVTTQRGRPLNTGTALPAYQEYFPVQPGQNLLNQHIMIGNAMSSLIKAAAGSDAHAKARSDYKVKPSFSLYAAPGDSSDFVFSTQLEASTTVAPQGFAARIKSNFPVHSFTIEAGHDSDGEFWPSKAANKNQFLKVRREIQFSVIALLKFIATWTAPVAPPASPSPSPTPTPTTTTSAEGCTSVLILIVGAAAALGFLSYLLITHIL